MMRFMKPHALAPRIGHIDPAALRPRERVVLRGVPRI